MKRFYKIVTTQTVPGGFEIHLDGKPVKTPARRILLAPTKDLANALQHEWATQETTIVPDAMPLTQILTTAIDRIADDRATIEEGVLAYLDTDLLCYRATDPDTLIARQARLWNPWLVWFEKAYGARLETTDQIRALRQDEAAHHAVRAAVQSLAILPFTLLQLVVSLSGSLVLGLAFTAGKADADIVFRAFYAEEDFKAEIYNAALHGFAPHEEKSRASVRRDLDAAQTFRDAL